MNQTKPATETFETYRPRLLRSAYRMTGSHADAEDLVQETWLRWHGREAAQPEHAGAWLSRVLVNLCLDYLKSAAKKREQYPGPWLPEPVVAASEGTEAERNHALDYGMLVLWDQLNPMERAVLILRESFDYAFRDIAEQLDIKEAHARQIARRARQRLQTDSQGKPAGPGRHRAILNQFLNACQSGDLQALLALFHQDITLTADGGGKVVSALRPIYGADRVSRFLIGIFGKIQGPIAVKPLWANGQAALLIEADDHSPTLVMLACDDQGVRRCFLLRNPDKLARLARIAHKDS
ncbi:RNA polymerase sigma factor SigJ [Acanthopleuribacter pedis]|uniref:RNA polymerase sigma factor SigJ n=1 Tax=Acanthopleuribacter pedis TaxID=442870 RepID=A0A8J7Q9Z8_9BACT|nr:RNA polymerase sigma factor SigJ [Acanthopleuribacter pedis]MBO1320550.1 RNA polymerase sigma factor SigJ [Acanthopleuribacter pedis]